MKIGLSSTIASRRSLLGSTLAEVSVSVAIVGVMFVSLYACMTSGFAYTLLARENLRGTQIILERMEGIRLFNWNQIVYSNMVPDTFTSYYYPMNTNSQSQGATYYGTMAVTRTNMTPSATYADSMRMVTVSVTWTNTAIQRTRTMTTFISKTSIQNYVYY